jgi:hypothetical protein
VRRSNIVATLLIAGLTLNILGTGCTLLRINLGTPTAAPLPSATMLPTPVVVPTPLPTRTPAPTAVPVPQRVRFAKGATSGTLTARVSEGRPAAFVLYVLIGQTMTVKVSNGANILVLDTRGQVLTSAGGALAIKIATSGDHTLVISGSGDVTLDISIPPP